LPRCHPAEAMLPLALAGFPGLRCDARGLCTIDATVWRGGAEELGGRLRRSGATGDFTPFAGSSSGGRALGLFLSKVESGKRKVAKAQVAGPCTVLAHVRTTGSEPIAEVPGLAEDVVGFLRARTLGLAQRISGSGIAALVFIDEPVVDATEGGLATRALKSLLCDLRLAGAVSGIHCCGAADWGRVLALDVDFVSFDVGLSLSAVLDNGRLFRAFLGRGGRLCLGVVPTALSSIGDLGSECDSVEALLCSAFAAEAGPRGVLSRSLLTPACGLGLRTVAEAERIVAALGVMQRHLRALVARG
jgi:hypothetical protein